MHRLSRCARRCHAHQALHRLPDCVAALPHPIKSFTTSSKKFVADDDPSSVKIRWYEQISPGVLRQKPQEEVDEGERAAQELKAKIQRLEKELQDMQSGKSLEFLSPEDREKVERARKKSGSDSASPSVEKESPVQYVPQQSNLEIKFELPLQNSRHLKHLNSLLRQVTTSISDANLHAQLWKEYARCRLTIPTFPTFVPEGAWDVLWASVRRAVPLGVLHSTRLRTLVDDMVKGGRDLNQEQTVILIESLHVEGKTDEALQKWKSGKVLLSGKNFYNNYIQELGIRLYASIGDPQNAQDLAFELLANNRTTITRAIPLVIQAWAAKQDNESVKKAWALYLHVRIRVGSGMSLEDYDKLTMCFINAGHPNLALAIFKDMMLSKQPSQHDSTSLYKASLGIFGGLLSSKIDATALTKISLTSLTLLPRRFQNKFFFGSWMKRLIGLGEVDAATGVLQLMYERGISPDAKHVNGIIGAWLRGENARNKEKALQMGWAMIQQRLDFVASRQTMGSLLDSKGLPFSESTSLVPVSTNPDLYIQYRRIVPRASIETFSLLLLYYERRNMLSYVHHLQDCLKAGEILPNSFFMNHLLYAELRQGQHLNSWNIYTKMTKHVQPDLETFACLWDCEKLHLDRLTMYPNDHFPSARRIFCEMMQWIAKTDKGSRALVQKNFSRDLYNQIIRCFCLAKDLEGTMVALHALKDTCGLYPNPDTIRMITLQIARIGQEQPKIGGGRRRSRWLNNPQLKSEIIGKEKQSVAKVTDVLNILAEQRAQDLQEQDIKPENFDPKERAEESLHLLAEFLWVVLRRSVSDDAAVDSSLEKVAWDMGTGGRVMGNPFRAARAMFK